MTMPGHVARNIKYVLPCLLLMVGLAVASNKQDEYI
jgi:hypothetical protein